MCDARSMSGYVCLQGGREFTPECEEMDRTVIDAAAARHVGVIAGAARIGSDYAGASSRARVHYERLGTHVRTIPDPRVDVDAALAALDGELDLVVLPGGSPSSLLGVLSGSVGERMLALHAAGTAISGASAGAMVLCSHMARPDRGDVTSGLGLVEGLALPHWTPGADPRWPVPDITLWGLPECSGVVIDPDGARTAVGIQAASLRVDGTWIEVPRAA